MQNLQDVFFLQTNGSGVLSFAGVSVAGTIVSSAIATDSTQRSVASTSYATGSNTLSITITPSSASNKILLMVSTRCQCNGNYQLLTIYRDSTNLVGSTNFIGSAFNHGGVTEHVSFGYLDSPATTSSITYQVYFRGNDGNTNWINSTEALSGSQGNLIALEIKG